MCHNIVSSTLQILNKNFSLDGWVYQRIFVNSLYRYCFYNITTIIKGRDWDNATFVGLHVTVNCVKQTCKEINNNENQEKDGQKGC